MVRSANEAASYTKMHIQYNIVIPAKLQHLATFWPWGCTILQILLYTVQCDNYNSYINWNNHSNSSSFFINFSYKKHNNSYLQSFIPPNNDIFDIDCCIRYYCIHKCSYKSMILLKHMHTSKSSST